MHVVGRCQRAASEQSLEVAQRDPGDGSSDWGGPSSPLQVLSQEDLQRPLTRLNEMQTEVRNELNMTSAFPILPYFELVISFALFLIDWVKYFGADSPLCTSLVPVALLGFSLCLQAMWRASVR